MPSTLYLIDGHALAYRMYFALTAGGSSTRWQTSKGEPTAGIYGFARELIRIIEQEKPEYIAVAVDVGKTFRDEIFPEYKGTREKMPDDLRPQIGRIREMVDAFNIPRLEMEGFEADDVLGSIARIANEQGLGVKIITGDRDLLQLVNPRTTVYLAGDDQNYVTAAGGSSARWQTSKGQPTAGIYGFARELIRIIEQERPEYIAVAFDVGKTFRDQIFPEYKGTREKMPDDLRPQISRIREMVDVFNIPRLEMEGFEADDVLGSIAHIANEQGLGVKIITGDRDLLQLVNERTTVYLAGDDQNYITDEDVIKKLGVRPAQVVDYKALVGDKSDNIPGVAGVGEKTAITLLEKFQTLDNVYSHIDEVENRWKTKLEQNKDKAYLSYNLAKIKTDIEVKLDLQHAKADDLDFDAIEAFFKEMEFRTLLKILNRLSGKEVLEAAAAAGDLKSGQQMSMFANE